MTHHHAHDGPNTPPKLAGDCVIDEIIQYQCELHRAEVVCVPLVRLFRRCRGQPAVEVTPVYDALGRPIARAPEFVYAEALAKQPCPAHPAAGGASAPRGTPFHRRE
ncbi:hypothetical protein H9P43_001356 [Blastocladiella emersonii ATCC 22665]|nr:hypothetical protein H9P43_001356 [Blastocladiella emersonii ATCC 22665]